MALQHCNYHAHTQACTFKQLIDSYASSDDVQLLHEQDDLRLVN